MISCFACGGRIHTEHDQKGLMICLKDLTQHAHKQEQQIRELTKRLRAAAFDHKKELETIAARYEKSKKPFMQYRAKSIRSLIESELLKNE